MAASLLQGLTPGITLACSLVWQRKMGLDKAAAQTIEAFVHSIEELSEPIQLQLLKRLLGAESVEELLRIFLDLSEKDINATEAVRAIQTWMQSRLAVG